MKNNELVMKNNELVMKNEQCRRHHANGVRERSGNKIRSGASEIRGAAFVLATPLSFRLCPFSSVGKRSQKK